MLQCPKFIEESKVVFCCNQTHDLKNQGNLLLQPVLSQPHHRSVDMYGYELNAC